MDYKEQITRRLEVILREVYHDNKSKMGLDVGVDESRIRSYTQKNVDKRSMPSAEFIASLINNVGINPDWILFGTGTMYKKNTDEFNIVAEPDVKYETKDTNINKTLSELTEMLKSQQESINEIRRQISGEDKKNTAGSA